jgi:hypothetical protein
MNLQASGKEDDANDEVQMALQSATLMHPAMVVGLIAQMTGNALPNAIVETTRHLLLLGQDILGVGPGIHPTGGKRDAKMRTVRESFAASAPAVQLDRSAAGP